MIQKLNKLNSTKILLASFLFFAPHQLSAREFKLPGLTDYAPYSFRDEDGEFKGYGVDLTTRLLQTPTNEHTLGFIIDPTWERAMKNIEYGTMDFLYEVTWSQKRTEFMEYIGVTDIERYKIIVPEHYKIDDIASLDDFIALRNEFSNPEGKIYYAPNYIYPDDFSNRIKNDPSFAYLFDTEEKLISLLGEDVWNGLLVSLGRIPARIVSETDGNLAITHAEKLVETNPNAVRVKALSISHFEGELTYIVIPKLMDPQYKQLLRENYEEARKDGSFEKIWGKWFKNKEVPPIQ